MANTRIFKMAVSRVYPLYIEKVTKKGRTKAELDTVLRWLTGYQQEQLAQQLATDVDFTTFFAQAPQLNEKVTQITGLICGYRVEAIEDPLLQKIRYLDKLVDELGNV